MRSAVLSCGSTAVVVLLLACPSQRQPRSPGVGAGGGTAPDPSAKAPVSRGTGAEDPGAGLIACGSESCFAGSNVCCLTDEENPACKSVGGDCAWRWAACDGPGDCPAGQICCEEADLALVSYYSACVPLEEGKAPCWGRELCSVNDSGCERPGASCSDGACVGPRRRAPDCDGTTCPAGSRCMWDAGDRDCVTGEAKSDEAVVIECDRGGDCAPDELCWEDGMTREHLCTRVRGLLDSGRSLCADASDCAAYCPAVARWEQRSNEADDEVEIYRTGVPICEGGTCECHPRCKSDGDCPEAWCTKQIQVVREGHDASSAYRPFCNSSDGVCDCRK